MHPGEPGLLGSLGFFRGQNLVHARSARRADALHRVATILHGRLDDGLHLLVLAAAHAIAFVHLGTSVLCL